jgi:oxazoline/thiazoline dehydrogenase
MVGEVSERATMSDRLFVRIAADVPVELGEDGSMAITTCQFHWQVARAPASLRRMAGLLAQGRYTEQSILDAFAEDGNTMEYATGAYVFQQLKAAGVVEYVAQVEGGEILIDCAPAPHFADGLSPAADDDQLVASRFALMRMECGAFIWETPLSVHRVKTCCSEAARCLTAFLTPSTRSDVDVPGISRHDLETLIEVFRMARVLVHPAQEQTDTLRMWEFHDLLFQTRSRLGRMRNVAGALFPFAGEIPPAPAVKRAAEATSIALERPDLNAARLTDPPFEAVIAARRSRYPSTTSRISAEALGIFLYRCARVKDRQQFVPDGYPPTVQFETTHRPYPAAGGLYDLEIYPLVYHCDGLDRGLYYYHPEAHTLTGIDTRPELLEATVDLARLSAKGNTPQVLLLITSRFPRMAWKYRSQAFALTLKTAGVLTAHMYLTAEVLGLAGCALGAGNADLFARMTGIPYFDEPAIADFMLGARVNSEEA